LEAEFDGEFDGANKIKGVYKSNNGAVYDETGHFEITKV
jgi:hypothetical protein